MSKKKDSEKALRDKIVAQALQEITFARQYKQGKIANWQKNEALYYSKKVKSDESRANVDLGRMQEYVHTILSKIDNPLIFKFTKRKEAQLKRVARLNSLRLIDAQNDDWDIKDIAGKKQAVIYGRAIYSYYADSYNGYCAHLDPVDVYDFLIDPSGGGLDIERAMFMGRYGVVKTKSELKDGVKDGIYLKSETETLIEGNGNAGEATQEETNKASRTYDTNVYTSKKEIGDPNKYKFWEWYTTYEGTRYYLLLNETGATAIRCEELTEIFESGLWPFWTWAAFIDLTEFWSPSYCDYVREIFMAQSVSVNQALDNSEQINKPQKVVNVGAIENLAELKYRRDGYIKVKKEFDADKALQIIKVPSIDTPIKVFDLLEKIQEKSSGVTAGSKGVSDEKGKVGIYEGNQVEVADRFGLLNKSYSFGYRRFAKLWEHGVREHLTKKTAIDILGPNGVDMEEVSRRDIFRKGDKFNVLVEASDAETALADAEKRAKIAFLSANAKSGVQNPKKAYEIAAGIVGFEPDTIRELMDLSEFGDAEIMSEAERDIERILDGEKIEPNELANAAYKQRFIDYMRDHKEDIDMEQFTALAEYILTLDDIIMRNTVRAINLISARMAAAPVRDVGGRSERPVDVPQDSVLETPTVNAEMPTELPA